MGIQIGVVSSDQNFVKNILSNLQDVYNKNKRNIEVISLVHIKNISKAIDFVNFEFPEFLILKLDDKDLDIINMLERINQDPWLHSTGILLIVEKPIENYSSNLHKLNILSLISYEEIMYQLPKILKIILTNRHVLLQQGFSKELLKERSGTFTLENDPSMVTSYVNIITSTLLSEKLITPNKENGLRIALTELLMNAIEHGNCEISFEEKSAFLDNNGNINDLIKEKNSDPEINKRKVTLDYRFSDENLKFTVTDCGSGFDHKNMKYNPEAVEDLMRPHGRGIYMAGYSVESLEYNEKGNQVTIFVSTDKDKKNIPMGFINQKELNLKAGQTVFEQGDRSNSLYYIIHGVYDIEYKGKKIAELNPTDLFLGEMSFLLNNIRGATVRAQTDGKLVEIPKNSFVNIIKRYPHYGLFLSKLLAKRLELTNQKLL